MADTKISALPAVATPVPGTDQFAVNQGGVTKRVTLSQLAGIEGGFAALDSGLLVPNSYLKRSHGVLLDTQTASSSAQLDFTGSITSTYDEYIFEFIAVLPATAGANLLARASQNNGSSWDSTTGNYVGTTGVNATYTAWAAQGGCAVATNVAAGNLGPFGVYGHMRIWPSVSRPWFAGQTGYLTNTPARVIGTISGDYEPAAFNAMRFLFSSGNIASGTIRLYGVGKG